MTGSIDFFISYRGARTDWARWINWVVRSAGYTTVLMDEFHVGTDWTDQMRMAVKECRRLIPLFSADYWESGACVVEWNPFLRQHMDHSTARCILPLGIEACEVPEMDAGIIRRDLYKLDRDTAHAAILAVLKGIAPVSAAAALFTDPEPPYPGLATPDAPAADWPDTAPAFSWPLADHGPARDGFAALVTRTAPQRLLCIHGVTETGKSHLTRSFLRNALRFLPDCRCGRFDFRGTSDVEGGLTAFVQHLGVAVPAMGNLAARLTAILEALAKKEQPTLLIFDTYESAGEADRWVRETLLNRLLRAPWLRVITAGQTHPGSAGEATIIKLTAPTLDDWQAYASENRKSVTLDYVKQTHDLCGGSAALLASIFGPAA